MDGSSWLRAVRVTSESTPGLRIHVEEQMDAPPTVADPQLAPLLAAFEKAMGWELHFEQNPVGIGEAWSTPIEGGQGPVGRLVLLPPHVPENDSRSELRTPGQRGTNASAELSNARPLAMAIAGLLGEVNRLRHAVWQREAELAAGVPVTARSNDEQHLAERLEAVLKAGAEAICCQAAGLYLLDEATSELKLRAIWGLPEERLLAPARPLRGAVADLEALLGHAVVLEDASLLPHWRCPEDFPAAVCVPVSTPSIPLGTLWVYCDESRDFSPEQTNLLEIIAGRLAADLEREMLLAAGTKAKNRDQQIEIAARWQQERLPSIAPLLDDYEVAGWTQQAETVGGDFHDWFVQTDGRLALMVGDANGSLLDAALGAASLHAAVKSHAVYPHCAGALLWRVNESLVAASAGDQRASLAYAVVNPASGEVELGLAGDTAAILVGPDNRLITTTDAPQLGQVAEAEFDQDQATLHPGEVLLLISGGCRKAVDGVGLVIGETPMASLIANHLRESAESLASRLRRLLAHDQPFADDMTVLVVKRRSK